MFAVYGSNDGREQTLLTIYTTFEDAKTHIHEWVAWYRKVWIKTV